LILSVAQNCRQNIESSIEVEPQAKVLTNTSFLVLFIGISTTSLLSSCLIFQNFVDRNRLILNYTPKAIFLGQKSIL
jgi:hypothetical protein